MILFQIVHFYTGLGNFDKTRGARFVITRTLLDCSENNVIEISVQCILPGFIYFGPGGYG